MKKTVLLGTALLIVGLSLAGCGSAGPEGDPPEAAGQPAQRATSVKNHFEMNFYSDKAVYKSTDAIQIWATLEYVGDGDTVTIWHGEPYVVFSITDGEAFNVHGTVLTLLTPTLLNRGERYRFDYQKSGGFNADDPKADFWERFYREKDLLLPEGTYTVAAMGAFSLTEKVVDSQSGLLCELKITVEP